MSLRDALTALDNLVTQLKEVKMRGSPTDSDLRRIDEVSKSVANTKKRVAAALPLFSSRTDADLVPQMEDLLEALTAENDTPPQNIEFVSALVSAIPAEASRVVLERGLAVMAATDGSIKYLRLFLSQPDLGRMDPIELVSAATFSQTGRIPAVYLLLGTFWESVKRLCAEQEVAVEELEPILADFFAEVQSSKRAIPKEDRSQRLAVLKLLCELDAPCLNLDVVNAQDGQTAFSRAAHEGDVAVMQLLVDTGKTGDVNLVLPDGTTALIRAVFSDSLEAVTLVLDRPFVDVQHKAEDGTALDVALALKRRTAILDALKGAGALASGVPSKLDRAPSIAHMKKPVPASKGKAVMGAKGGARSAAPPLKPAPSGGTRPSIVTKAAPTLSSPRGGPTSPRGATSSKPRASFSAVDGRPLVPSAKPGGKQQASGGRQPQRRLSVVERAAVAAILKRYYDPWRAKAAAKVKERHRRGILRIIVHRAGPAMQLRAAFCFWATLGRRRIQLRKLAGIRQRAHDNAASPPRAAPDDGPPSLGRSTEARGGGSTILGDIGGGGAPSPTSTGTAAIVHHALMLQTEMSDLRSSYASGAFFADEAAEEANKLKIDRQKSLLAKIIKKSHPADLPPSDFRDHEELLTDLLETLINDGEGKGPVSLLLCKALLTLPLPWGRIIGQKGLVTIAACDGNLSFLSWLLDVPDVAYDIVEVTQSCMFSQDRRIPGVLLLLKHESRTGHFEQHADELKDAFADFLADIAANSRALPHEDRDMRLEVVRRICIHSILRPDPDLQGPDGQTVFSRACGEGDVALLKVLCGCKWVPTNINRLQPDGTTALMQAVVSNKPEVVVLILQQPGVDLNTKGKEGTALDMAIALDRDLTIAAMLKAGGGEETSTSPLYARLGSMHGSKAAASGAAASPPTKATAAQKKQSNHHLTAQGGGGRGSSTGGAATDDAGGGHLPMLPQSPRAQPPPAVGASVTTQPTKSVATASSSSSLPAIGKGPSVGRSLSEPGPSAASKSDPTTTPRTTTTNAAKSGPAASVASGRGKKGS